MGKSWCPHSDPFRPLPSHTGPVQDRYHRGWSGVQLPAYFTESPDSPVRYTPTRSRTPSMTSRRTRSRSRSPSVKRSRSPPARERGPQPPDRSRGYHHDRGPPAPDRDRERATSRHEPRTQYHSQDAPPRYSPPSARGEIRRGSQPTWPSPRQGRSLLERPVLQAQGTTDFGGRRPSEVQSQRQAGRRGSGTPSVRAQNMK